MAQRKVSKMRHRTGRATLERSSGKTGVAKIPGGLPGEVDSFRLQLTGATDSLEIRTKLTHSGVTGKVLRSLRERLGLTIADVVRSNHALALRVPSAVVPDEANYLVNPGHPRFGEIRIIGRPRPVILDPRLLR